MDISKGIFLAGGHIISLACCISLLGIIPEGLLSGAPRPLNVDGTRDLGDKE